MFDDKKYIHTLGFVYCLGCHYPYWWFPLLFQQSSSLDSIHRVSFMHYLHLVHAGDTQGRWFVKILFVRVPHNHQAIALYLMLTDERCLNALLSTSLLPSNSSHLFQKGGLKCVHIFPHIHTLSVRQQVYTQVSPLQSTYIRFGAQN